MLRHWTIACLPIPELLAAVGMAERLRGVKPCFRFKVGRQTTTNGLRGAKASRGQALAKASRGHKASRGQALYPVQGKRADDHERASRGHSRGRALFSVIETDSESRSPAQRSSG